MAIKTYTGSCHCGAVRFEADLDLSAGTSKCDCRFCLKSRNWSVIIKPESLRLRAGEEALADYPLTDSPVRHPFCMRCGVRAFSRGRLEELGGDYVSIRVACLDDASRRSSSAVRCSTATAATTTGGIPRPRSVTCREAGPRRGLTRRAVRGVLALGSTSGTKLRAG